VSYDDKTNIAIVRSGGGNSDSIIQQIINGNMSDLGTSIFIFVSLIVLVLIILSLHNRIAKLIEFIASVPIYKRVAVFFIGATATYFSSNADKKVLYIPIILGYISTFAFNEYCSKKDIEKAISPLQDEIEEKEKCIDAFRRVIEEKKNIFRNIVVVRINNCLRVRGKTDTELLQKIRKNIEELQDIIVAEKTFFETPDEALRRVNNLISGDSGLALQTMVEDSVMFRGPLN